MAGPKSKVNAKSNMEGGSQKSSKAPLGSSAGVKSEAVKSEAVKSQVKSTVSAGAGGKSQTKSSISSGGKSKAKSTVSGKVQSVASSKVGSNASSSQVKSKV